MRFRPVQKTDLSACRMLLHPALGLSDRALERIVGIWEDLATAGTFSVVEDPELGHPASIQGFGASVFVTDSFVDDFMAQPRNYLDAAVYERILARKSPVLSRAEIGRANASEGLNLVVLNFGLRNQDMSHANTQLVTQLGSAAFYFLHAGYRMKIMLNEVFGAGQARYMEAGGFRLCADGRRSGTPDDERCPYLFAMRREWIEPAAIHPLSFLFHTRRPRLGFSATEQRVLCHGLLNKSDAEIAESLGLSLDGVKKTWRRVYERASRRMPALVPDGARPWTGQRGVEKRRHLLDYVRMNLEEVRPWSDPRPDPAIRVQPSVR